MHFSDDELREALQKKNPGESFTEKVMARVARERSEAANPPGAGYDFRRFWHWLGLRPVLLGATLAVLVIGGTLGAVKHRREQEMRAGEAAKRQVLLGLRISSAKLKHVLERAESQRAPVMEEKNP